MTMNDATIREVTRLLNDATYDNGSRSYYTRMAILEQEHEDGQTTQMQYLQLVDAVNTQHQTGSYEGCLIWRNAEANQLEDDNS